MHINEDSITFATPCRSPGNQLEVMPGGLADAVALANADGQVDYSLKPIVCIDCYGNPYKTITDRDAVVFCCRRGEREIELTEAFTDDDFQWFCRHPLADLYFATLTQYHEKFANLPIAFPPVKVEQTLAECISDSGKTQFHCAESEKFAHVTFFLNGGRQRPFPGETDGHVPSPKCDFTTKPELSLPQVVEKTVSALGSYDFVVVNFANGDVIGHMDSAEAKFTACCAVSENLDRLVHAAEEKDYVVLVAADHGNIETLRREDGRLHVAHTINPIVLVADDPRGCVGLKVADGSLCDLAPTVLKIMGIAKPNEMTGIDLTGDFHFGSERRVLLVILDGWGLGQGDDNDIIHLSETVFWDDFVSSHPHSLLHAHGQYVGLAKGKPGNSEAGHQNIGAGRIVLQDDCRIDASVADGSYQTNPALIGAVEHARKNHSALHLLTLISSSSSHGSINYAVELCKMAKGLPVYLHLISDGRSSTQGQTPLAIHDLQRRLKEIGCGEVVSCVGRGYALDRDKNYDKIKVAYDSLVNGIGHMYCLVEEK
jgi:2,3-bisphosphoglycerate-independent phosphoglycerate mutase